MMDPPAKPTARYTGSDPAVYRRIMDETRSNAKDIRSRLNNVLLDDNKRDLLERAEVRILSAVSDILADIENRLRT